MHVLIAPDSFKGSLSAPEVCNAIAKGIQTACPEVTMSLVPLADGGEGTAEIFCQIFNGEMKKAVVTDPLGRPLSTSFAMLPDNTVVIDIAAASGIVHLNEKEKDPRHTSTYGTGLLIKKALDLGTKKIILGLGGSATNDGGAGIAMALGYRLLDKNGLDLFPGGIHLQDLHQIDTQHVDLRLQNCSFIIATDVTNPLLGKKGASYVFGPQKGANKTTVEALEKALTQLSHCINQDLHKDVADIPGAGAAGGAGAGGIAFLNGEIKSGFVLISHYTNLEDKIKKADIVITGEGLFDATSSSGKVISGVIALAEKHQKPLIILAGNALCDHNLPVFTLVNEQTSVEKAMTEVKNLLKERAEYIFHVALPKLNFNL